MIGTVFNPSGSTLVGPFLLRDEREILMTKFQGSPQQQHIWTLMKDSDRHLVIDAYAGTGKTTTIVRGFEELPKMNHGEAFFTAFNRSAADDLRRKLPKWVPAGTTHSLGYKALRESYEDLTLADGRDREKTIEILEDLLSERDFKKKKGILAKTVSLLKANGISPSSYTQDHLEDIIMMYSLRWYSSNRELFKITREVLKVSLDMITGTGERLIDFDDMIWAAVVLGCVSDTPYKLLVVDEVQDLNPAQHDLVMSCGERLIIIGDRHQSIYGFRGADAYSMRTLTNRLDNSDRGIEKAELTVCWRCPKLAVQLAQNLVPNLESPPEKKEGVVQFNMTNEDMLDTVRAGDMVLCRTNAPLVRTLYRLYAKKKRAYIQGRNIGTGLKSVFEDLGNSVRHKYKIADTDPDFLGHVADAAQAKANSEREKLDRMNASPSRYVTLEDKWECVQVFLENAETYPKLIADILKLFDDRPGVARVRLSSVHRAKGQEAENVFLLEPEQFPHPMAEQDWEQLQERNIAYVAATRVQDKLTFVGTLGAFFTDAEKYAIDLSPQEVDLEEEVVED